MYQNCHWQCAGLSFYQHHLLFQRLYEAISGNIDSTAEKIVGLFSSELIDLTSQLEIMNMLGEKFPIDRDMAVTCFQTGIKAEMSFQKLSMALRKVLKEENKLSLGMDDLIAAQANDSEERLYLLKSSLPR
jgi:DNA-binding ferritin-like protein